MTQTERETRGDPLGHEARFCLCESYARVTERAPRTPTPRSRAESGRWPFWAESTLASERGVEPFSIPRRV